MKKHSPAMQGDVGDIKTRSPYARACRALISSSATYVTSPSQAHVLTNTAGVGVHYLSMTQRVSDALKVTP